MAAKKTRSRWRAAGFVLAALAGVLGLLIILAASGLIFDISFVRRTVEDELGQVLGHRAVIIEGDLLLAPSLSTPGVRAESVRVLSPGQDGSDWARLKSVELGVRLSSLWHGELEFNHILIKGLSLFLGGKAAEGKVRPEKNNADTIFFKRISGGLSLSRERTSLRDLRLTLGRSLLTGSLEVLYKPDGRPGIKADLRAPTIRLEDFQPFILESPVDQGQPPPKDRAGKDRAEKMDLSRLERIIRGALDRLDGEFRLEVDRVLSGPDRLGHGLLQVKLLKQCFSMEPLQVELPGGSFRLDFICEDQKPKLAARLKIKARNFQYGFFMRRQDPDSKAEGVISLEAELSALTPSLGQLMQRAGGRFAFGLWPKNLDAGLIDLWAANLITMLFTRFSDKGESRINCLQVVLDMEKGRMVQKKVVLDTSTMRVKGEVDINFNTNRVKALFYPQAKSPQFFSLEIPVEIKGSFSDLSADVQAGGLLGGALKALTSPMHVPIVRLFGQKPPADGHDVCPSPRSWRPLGK